jgi:PAS domain S-box-containing protein
MLDNIEEPIIMLNRDWQYTAANAAACKYIGKERAELLGSVVWDVYPALDGTAFGEAIRQAMESTEPSTFEEYYPPRDRWFRAHFFPTPDGLVVQSVDVTDHKLSQAGLAEVIANHNGSQSQDSLEAFDMMPDPITVMDADLRYVFVNEAAKRASGRPESEWLGRRPSDLDPKLAAVEDKFREALRTQRRSRFEYQLKRNNKWYAIEIIPTGKQVIAYTVDISRLKASEETVGRLTETLEQALEVGWDRRAARDPTVINVHTHKPKQTG